MATITTKYSVGDVVYQASTTTEQKQHPCPDCKGERKWKATSPAGQEYSFGCPRCSGSYYGKDELSLAYSASTPIVRRLTVGSVRHDSHRGETEYMCLETGVGSGSIYRESLLFADEADALTCATVLAVEANRTTPWIVQRYNRSLAISDYQLENAALKAADDARRRAGELLWNMSDLFETIQNASDKDEILEAVEEYKARDWLRDKEAATDAEQVSP